MNHINTDVLKQGIGGNITGGIFALWALLLPVHVLIYCCMIAITIDFIVGNIADYHRKRRKKQRYTFESEKAWGTIWKTFFVILGIGFAFMIDNYVLAFSSPLRLANFFTAYFTGTLFWSFLENAAEVSNDPVFRWLKKYMKDKTEIDFDKYCDCETKNKENDETT